MKIIIVFVGLIVQVNQPWSLDNTAVLPYGKNETAHRAQIEIPLDAIENADDQMRTSVKKGQTHVIKSLKGVDVRVEGSRGLFSRMSRELLESLPSLKELAPGCRLSRAVRDREQDNKLASFIDYRGGRRMPDSYLARKLTFPNTSWVERCVVCGVRWEAELREPTATLVFTDVNGGIEKIRVRAGAEIVVRNVPEVPGFGHFVHAFDIYENCESFARPRPPTAQCDRPTSRCANVGEQNQEGETSPGEDCTGGNGP